MKTLVEAPPRRKPVNWYRVIPWVLLATVTILLCANVVYSWDIINADNFLGAVEAHGGWFWRGILALIALPTAFVLGMLCLGVLFFLAATAMHYTTEGVNNAWDWWRRKVAETDRKNLTYED